MSNIESKRNRGLNKPKEFATVHGWGVNDSDYKVTEIINGKLVTCLYYEKWSSMIERSHSKKAQQKRPSLKDNDVCIDWKYFSNFKSWMQTQQWEGMHLDKDILIVGNKRYSPETCCFVPNYINQLVNAGSSVRSEKPLGVVEYKDASPKAKRYGSRLKTRHGGIHLGSFHTTLEAHFAWVEQKANYIEDTVAFWAKDPETKHSFSHEIADSLLDRVWRMRLNVATGQETLLI